MPRVFKILGCPACARRWWYLKGDQAPTHLCPHDGPPGGLLIAELPEAPND